MHDETRRRKGNASVVARGCGYGLIVAAFLETLWINAFTLAQIARARTSVPWMDEWAIVQDLAQIDRGGALWPILWAPYWGERQVVTRLLWMANAYYCGLGSLTWLTLLFQFLNIGVFIAIAWLLLRGKPLAPFLVACTLILNLLLSPFQMWNFVWSTQTMFVLIFLAAMGSFVCLSMGYASVAILLAALATLTMPNGLFPWPVLVLQAAYLRQSRRTIAVLALIGAIVIGLYLWHYTLSDIAADKGMGVGGMLRHPVQALLLVGVVVSGPVGFISNGAAAGFGVLALAITGYIAASALRLDVPERPWLAALVAMILFIGLSSLSIVAGRLDARFLSSDPIYSVPARYPTMVCVFWACVGLLVLYSCWRTRVRPVLLCVYATPFLYFMFATTQRQLIMAEDWADVFRGTDALGAAFLLNVPDEQMLARLWPAQSEREERVEFLRRRGLSMFHEPRAGWIGKNVADLFPPADADRCIGAVEKTTSLGQFARVQGWAWDLRSGESPDDILLTDAGGRVIGLARCGLRHGYFPGLLMEPGPVPLSHVKFRHSEWLGYVRLEANEPNLYGVFAKKTKICAISTR